METRSKRQAENTRPPYPHSAQSAPPPATSSLFQNPSSLAAMTQPPQHMLQTQQGIVSAPLPSPSSTQPATYMGSLAQQTPASYPAQQQRMPSQGQMAAADTYIGQRGDGSGAPETVPFLRDFNLVAEAAKRAEVACLSRDLGDFGL